MELKTGFRIEWAYQGNSTASGCQTWAGLIAETRKDGSAEKDFLARREYRPVQRWGIMRCGLIVFALVSLGFVCGCERRPDHPEGAGHAHTHQHAAPHGGILVEVGDHQFNVELVRDAVTGTLTLYTLDAHAENFVRTAMSAIELSITAGGQTRSLTLLPVANLATGETVGATSQYQAQAEWLKGATGLAGTIARLDFNGAEFQQISFGSKVGR